MNNIKIVLLLSLTLINFSFLFAQNNIKETLEGEIYSELNYRLIGPFRGGRSATVTGVTSNENCYYFGSTGGGVWKTENQGKTWKNISDGYFGGSIGAIAVSESNPSILYVGGGEKTVRGNVSSGSGMWKSIDGGNSWKSIGLRDSRHIPRIRINPTNPDILYAAVLGNIYKSTTERGVYKSIDGGETWNKILFANDNAGAIDLIIDPNNSNTLYASTWNIRRTPYSLSSGGDGSALWKSMDAGTTWKEISLNNGFAKGTLGIIGITVSPKNSEKLWAIVENKDNGGVYRSIDGGNNWTIINQDRKLRQRAWYYSRIYADPNEENSIYIVNVNYHKSTDGGKTFSDYRAPHGDHHDLWISPNNSKRMIIGDDGGAQVSTDGGKQWSTYHNQPTAQFYRVTTDDHFPYRIYAAQQDNSTIRINSRSDGSYISDKDWEATAGGESAHIAIDPKDNEIIYGGSYGGFLTRKNHRTGENRAINVWPDNPMGYGADGMKFRFQWNFPLFFSKHNPNKLYTFSNHVHCSTDEGQSWKVLSKDLTRNDPTKQVSSGGPITQDNTGVEYYCTIFAAAESPIKEGELWVGSDDGLIHLSKDDGQNWKNITPKNLPKWAMINSIEPSRYNPGTCYIAATKYKLGDFNPYLFVTDNYGKTWNQINSGIEKEHFTRVLKEDPKNESILYTGTENGMYISHNKGKLWNSFQMNLPIVPITDIIFKENSLIVATQGRSIWILDDITIIQQTQNLRKETNNHLFKPKTSYRTKGSAIKKNLLYGENIANGVVSYFYIKNYSEKDSIQLSYLNTSGDTLKTIKNYGKDNKLIVEKGLNKWVWNMRVDGAKKEDDMILWWANLQGPKVVPNKYSISLNINNENLTETFTIKKDPRSEVSILEMEKQFLFITKNNIEINKAHQAIKEIRKLHVKLKNFKEENQNNPKYKELLIKADSILVKTKSIEENLYQTKNKSPQDPLNYPIKLTNKLAHINSLVGIGDYPPTAQDIMVSKLLIQKIQLNIKKYKEIKQKDIKLFNILYHEMNIPFLE